MSLLRSFLVAFCCIASFGAKADGSRVVTDARDSAEWIAKALYISGYKADFTVDSLKEIDRFFDDNAPNGRPKPDGLLSSDLGARLFALGSYVGEVIRRSSDGEWIGNDNDSEAEINIALHLNNGTILRPVQRIMKRLLNGNENGVYVYGVVALSPNLAR